MKGRDKHPSDGWRVTSGIYYILQYNSFNLLKYDNEMKYRFSDYFYHPISPFTVTYFIIYYCHAFLCGCATNL